MDREHEIYSLNLGDVYTVMGESGFNVRLEEPDIGFIEDKVGEMFDWYSAIEYALQELKKRKQKRHDGAFRDSNPTSRNSLKE